MLKESLCAGCLLRSFCNLKNYAPPCASENAVATPSASDNSQSDAIALWQEILTYMSNGGMISNWMLSNREKVNAVVAQQHT